MSLFALPSAYSQTFDCGADDLSQTQLKPVSPEDFCFNTDHVIDNCVEVHLGINLHFFLNDNCDANSVSASPGTLNASSGGTITTREATVLGTQLIEEVNSFFTAISDNEPWNNTFHGVPAADEQCIPLRLVLTGIYFHCDTDAQNVGNSFSELNSYAVNPSTQLNYYITNITSSANGFASLGGTRGAQEDLSPGVFAHEFMHMLGIKHTFGSDDCTDTWTDLNVSWDGNQDGVQDAFVSRCWDQTPTPPANFPNLDPCDDNDFTVTHPCCEWSNQSNNLMTYSAWANNPDYSALTNCQLTSAIEHIAAYKCDYILGVDGCAPATAFVIDDPSTSCGTCIDMRPSFNETFFELDIANAQGGIVYDGPEIQGEAGRFCISPNIDKQGNATWPSGYITGQSYTATVSTWNDCGQNAQFDYTFTLPNPCDLVAEPAPNNQVSVMFAPTSDPTSAFVDVNSGIGSTAYSIYASHVNIGTQYGLVGSGTTLNSIASETIDISSWSNGVVAITVFVGDEVHSFQYFKS